MSAWDRFRRELEAVEGADRRSDWARQIIARFQRELSEDPPGWLLAAAGSRALAETHDEYGVLIDEEPRTPARPDRKAKARRELEAMETEVRRLTAQRDSIKAETKRLRQRRAERIVDRAGARGYVHRDRRDECLRDFEHDPDRLLAEFEPEILPAETDEEFARRFEQEFGFTPEGHAPARREPDEEAREIAREFGLAIEDVI